MPLGRWEPAQGPSRSHEWVNCSRHYYLRYGRWMYVGGIWDIQTDKTNGKRKRDIVGNPGFDMDRHRLAIGAATVTVHDHWIGACSLLQGSSQPTNQLYCTALARSTCQPQLIRSIPSRSSNGGRTGESMTKNETGLPPTAKDLKTSERDGVKQGDTNRSKANRNLSLLLFRNRTHAASAHTHPKPSRVRRTPFAAFIDRPVTHTIDRPIAGWNPTGRLTVLSWLRVR